MLSSARVWHVVGLDTPSAGCPMRCASQYCALQRCKAGNAPVWLDLGDHYDKNGYQVMCFEMGRFIVTHPIMGSCQKC